MTFEERMGVVGILLYLVIGGVVWWLVDWKWAVGVFVYLIIGSIFAVRVDERVGREVTGVKEILLWPLFAFLYYGVLWAARRRG